MLRQAARNLAKKRPVRLGLPLVLVGSGLASLYTHPPITTVLFGVVTASTAVVFAVGLAGTEPMHRGRAAAISAVLLLLFILYASAWRSH